MDHAIENTTHHKNIIEPHEWEKEQESDEGTSNSTSTSCETITETETSMRLSLTTRPSSSGEHNVIEDNDDSDDDECTSRTDNTKSNQSRSTSDRSSRDKSHQNNGPTSSTHETDQKNSSPSSSFEINCSPLDNTSHPKSYYEQTRTRQLQSSEGRTETQANNPLTPTPSMNTNKQILQHWRRPTNEQYRKRWQPPLTEVPFDEDGESTQEDLKGDESRNNSQSAVMVECELENDEKSSCRTRIESDDESGSFTLADSEMYYSSNLDDVTISTSTNLDSNIESNNSISNISGSVLTSSSDMGNSMCSSLSRGGEHISSRLKKYGMVNVYEIKRKQQRIRNKTVNNNPHNSGLVRSSSMTVLSGLTTEGGGASTVAESGLINASSNTSISDNAESAKPGMGIPTRIRTAPLHVQMAVEEIHRWLFTEGGHFEDVQTLMTQYSLYVREHFGIPLDRLYYGGVGLHPKLTAYLWKWEAGGEFSHSEMPPEVFARRNEIFSPDEPFCVMETGRADYVRIRHTDTYIPPDTAKWFRGGNYKDYFALPDYHRGFFKGGLAWSTKCDDGFCDDDIQFFRMTQAALTTIMRLHTNDMVLRTLTDRMESEIDDRTIKLGAANRKLEEANAEISRHASKQLEHFACMSHEIRTPLNCIVGLSSLLLENDSLDEELFETIQMVYNSADLVQGVVNDVLDYAKIESGHFELDIHPSDLQNTMNGVVHSISNKLRAQEKNVEIRTSYCARLGKYMTTDSRRVQQILYNILGNAAKFSREGTTIDFKVRIISVTDNDDEKKTNDRESNKQPLSWSANKIRFSIKDYGKGIEEENFEKIFQPFSQASKETQTIYGGTGLGLSITRNLVVRLGGTISIQSEIDKYTEFIVELPYDDELFDPSKYQKKMSETSIVVLDPNTEQRSKIDTPRGDDDFDPFRTEVAEFYDLNVLRCSSWGELESKLGLRANVKENYVFLAHEDIDEQQGFLNVEKIVGRNRCSWFTFGSDSPLNQPQRHFKSLTAIFPSVLIDKLVEYMGVDRSNSECFNSSFESQMSGFSAENTSSSHESEEEIEVEFTEVNPKRDVSPNNTSGDSPVELTSQSSQKEEFPTTITPMESDTTVPSASKKKFATKYPTRNLKVLVVDDNVINQKVLDRILKRLGVTDISIVNNGKKAVDISEKNIFDCIFMDMEMPVMGGLEACRRIVDRDKEAARVAFVTAHDIEDIREKADAAGAFGYISKPLKMQDIHKFLTVIEDIKNSASGSSATDQELQSPTKKSTKKKTEEPRKERPSPPKKKRCTKLYPPRQLKVLVAEDNHINQKVLHRILKRLGATDVTMVDNGKKAVDASAITKFDCILMDMQMPIMDGLEACKVIVKRDEKEEDPPKIIFVTAHALVEFKEKALASGAFDFVAKPFKMEDIDKVLTTLEDMKNNRNINSSVPETTPTGLGSSTMLSQEETTVAVSSPPTSKVLPEARESIDATGRNDG